MKRITLAFLFITLTLCQIAAKSKSQKVYMFGFCTSFTDSVAYITDIQEVEGARLQSKAKFLADRVVYSDQLHTYVEAMKGVKTPTCAVVYNTNYEKLLKEYQSVKKHHATNGHVILKELIATEFRFQAPQYESADVSSEIQ